MDLQVIETNNGGDLLKKGNDLTVVYGLENMPYLALFGGNIEQSTPVTRDTTQQAYDYWANSLINPGDTSVQLNSETERTLYLVPLTSSGRLKIEAAIKADLAFMQSFAQVTITTAIVATNRLRMTIGITQPGNLEQSQFIYIWDSTRADLLSDAGYSPNPISLTDEALQYELGFYL
jgi:hypothetical protein